MSSTATNVKIVPRNSEERGHADHGWLKTFHTFSFANYQHRAHQQFGSLRVINEDRVAAKTGFGTHSHAEFEIFSYVVDGELEHQDSMHNTEILSRGAVQLTSAGTGISHSEKCHGSSPVHFLQIWSLPTTRCLPPKYYTRHFSDEEKTDKWVRVVAPVNAEGVSKEREDKGPAPVHSNLTMFATLLNPSATASQSIKGPRAYIHVIQTSGYNHLAASASGAKVKLTIGGEEQLFGEGDGAYITFDSDAEIVVENVGEKKAEVVLFDINE